jgi:hypothetical protein
MIENIVDVISCFGRHSMHFLDIIYRCYMLDFQLEFILGH